MSTSRSGMLLSVALGLAASIGASIPAIGSKNDPFERKPAPINTGRRAEKAAAALRKAQAKRDRKDAKNRATAQKEQS